MDVFVRFWGTRGSIPAPGHSTRRFGGNTSCVEIRIGPTVLVCDAGTGIRELGLDLVARGSEGVDVHLFFSHMHWDHIQGFPFFVPAYERSSTIFVYETAPGADRVQRLLGGQMRSDHFPVDFSELASIMVPRHFGGDGTVELSGTGVKVSCFEQHHPGSSHAFAFECDGQKIVYATDNEIDRTLVNAAEAESDRSILRRPPEELLAFIDGADLLIADGQYTDEEYPAKVGWGHARCNTAVDLAVQAGVARCAIFHHDPLHTDTDVEQMIKEGRLRARGHGCDAEIFAAREGLELKI